MVNMDELKNNRNVIGIVILVVFIILLISSIYLFIGDNTSQISDSERHGVEYELIESEVLDGKYTLKANTKNISDIESYTWTIQDYDSMPSDNFVIQNAESTKQSDNIHRVGYSKNDSTVSFRGSEYFILSNVDEYEYIDVELIVDTEDGNSISYTDEVNLSDSNTIQTPNCDEHTYSSGDGSIDNPYAVTDEFDLQCVRANTDSHYEQTSDIDAFDTVSWYGGQGFTPIKDFKGVYNGNNHTIDNIYVNKTYSNSNVGVFESNRGEIHNVDIKDMDIKGADETGFIGLNRGEVHNVNTSGYIGFDIDAFDSLGDVSYDSSGKGGIVGDNRGEISKSYSEATIVGDSIGGLVGTNRGELYQSFFTGTLDVKGSNSGGVVGINNGGDISESYSKSDISSSDGVRIGGLVGFNTNGGDISKSYVIGDISGDDRIGGIVGDNSESSIHETYYNGTVIGDRHVGGVVGQDGGDITDSYWNSDNDIIESGEDISLDIINDEFRRSIGLSTDDMKGDSAVDNMSDSSFTSRGFDWDDTWSTVDSDYPILQWQEE